MALTEGDSTYSVANRLYDRIYSFKDYAGEAARVRELVLERAPGAESLLDVACGTGAHLAELRSRFRVAGVDRDRELLALARGRLPDVPLHHGDMRDFRLGRRFDAVTCLFSAVGYLTSLDDLHAAARTFAEHLEPGGVLLVEPWISPDDWREGHLHALLVDEDDLKVARLSRTSRDGDLSFVDMHYLVLTADGAEHFDERHMLRLHSDDDHRGALEAAGLDVEHDPDGLIGRGLWIGVKPRPAGGDD